MTEIQNKLDQAYGRLARIPVTGTSVKQMALAMQDIEDAFRRAGETPHPSAALPSRGEGLTRTVKDGERGNRDEAPGDAV